MKKYYIYFVDREGYGGGVTWKAKNLIEVKKLLKQYTRAWNLEPISDLIIKEK